VYVYADLLVAVNLVMNVVIILATGRIVGIHPTWGRILAGALFGALTSLAMLLPEGFFLRWTFVKIVVSLCMIGIVFYPLAWRRWPLVLAVFYFISFMLGGTVLAFLYFTDASTYLTNGIFSMQHASWITLISAAALFLIWGQWLWGRLGTRFWQAKYFVPIRVVLSDTHVQTTALIDSGNGLRDPISRLPVTIIEYECVKPLLPAEVTKKFDVTEEHDWINILQEMPHEWVSRLHILPFSSLGKRSGLLIGFRPDRIVVEDNGAETIRTDVIIGMCNRNLSSQGEYHALLHPDLVHKSFHHQKEAS
jgi:stage II sporulation protein GA (sporulation sigma-E factor processing peptidase)